MYPGIWACVEASIGVVVACIPSFTPIVLSCVRGRMPATEVARYMRNNHTANTVHDKGDVMDPGRMAAFNSSDETAVTRENPEAITRMDTRLQRRLTEDSYGLDELPLNGIFVTNEDKMTGEERTRRIPKTPTRERSRSRPKVRISSKA